MRPAPEALYLDRAHEPVFVTLHRPTPEAARDTAVILCPPFGWEEVCSYRSLRTWAERLALAGYPAVRLSLPGTGDSGGSPRDPDRVGAWVGAVDAGARWLASESGATRLVAIGLGLGGLVEVLAVAGGAPIDELVLWGTPARGRALVRQLRAFSRLEAARFFEGLQTPPPLPGGALEAGGFLLTAETVRDLERVDLTTVELPDGRPRRALLLKRDGIDVDDRLRRHLQAGDTDVTIAPGNGYADMTSHPQQAHPPLEVIDRVNAWLERSSRPIRSGPPATQPVPGARSSAEISLGNGRAVRETPVAIPQSFGVISGVLVEPPQRPRHDLRVLLLNAGAVRRIGPNRMWVECARRWAADGVPTLRLDVEGVGDADGDAAPYVSDAGLYVPRLVPQVLSAVDFLQARGDGERFILGGLCAGAYWAFHGALRDPRVTGALMLNPRALVWNTGLGPARDLRALLTEPFSLAKIRRVATGPRLRSFLRWVLTAPSRALQGVGSRRPTPIAEHDLDVALEQLRRGGKPALMLFAEHEPLYDELIRSGRAAELAAWPGVTIERIAVRDHTLRPNWAQQQAHAALDRAITRELAREMERDLRPPPGASAKQAVRRPPPLMA